MYSPPKRTSRLPHPEIPLPLTLTPTDPRNEPTSLPASLSFLDELNTGAADQTLARKQVVRVLREIQPQEYVALYWLGNGLHVLHDFTTDASVLRQVLADYESKSSRELDNSELVDARGLLGSNVSANQDELDTHIGDPTDTDTHLSARDAPETFDTMRLLAERTGGKTFYGTNDLAGAIHHAMSDSRVTYTLGYYPAAVKWDGSFHEIKVKVAVPGAKVRARTGYFALPDAPLASPKHDHTLISQLAASWLPATGIGLHVRAQASGPRALTARVYLDLREIQMQQKQGRWTGTVQSVFLQLDDAGHVLQADDRTFHPDFDAPSYQRVLQSGIIVRDVSSSNMGSIYVPLAQYFPHSHKPGLKRE